MNNHFSIIWGARQITHAQLQLCIASSIKHLKGMGVKAGDRVAVCDDNSVEYVVLLLSLWRMKAVAAPVSPRWPAKTTGSYTAKINAGPIFRSGDIKRVVCFDARHETSSEQNQDLDLGQEVTVIATSGSSGEPKAAVHTWGNHYYSAKGSHEAIPLMPGDRWLLSLPLYHVAGIGILVRCLLSGASLVVAGDGHLSAVLERGEVTHVSLVAAQLHRLLADDKNHDPLKSLKCILLGGGAIPKTLIARSLQLGLNVYLSYGLTEMSSQVATGKVVSVDKPCAKVLPYRQARIAPDGEVLVKGETLFKGYIAGTRLRLPLMSGGWFKTGDMGQLDAQEYLTITGRRDNMFISGGENIQPEEIEKALLNIEGVAEAMVIPKEDKEFGHRPVAFIKFVGNPLNEAQLVKHLQADLPRFKIPVCFYPWPQDLMAQGLKMSREDLLQLRGHNT